VTAPAAIALTADRCRHFPRCAGCPLVAEPYERQLTRKLRLVRETVLATVGAEVPIRAVVPAPAREGYRVQAKLMVHRGRRGTVLGLYAPGTHRVLDASDCPLHHPLLRRAAAAARAALDAMDVPIHGPGVAGVRYVLLRASEHARRVMVTLVSSRSALPGIGAVASMIGRAVPLAGLHLNLNTSAGNVIVGERTERIRGAPTLAERYGEVTLVAGPTAFVQANTRMAARIYARIAALAAVRRDERVLDLYCGVGGIALTIARSAREVAGVEASAEAVRSARENAAANGAANVRFVHADVTTDIARVLERGADVITLNPPRKGCGDDVARALAASDARRLVYLSCSPASFARDARRVTSDAFRLAAVEPFDLLPQTEHVELVAVFDRR
jgi:23S rRNA (uracil1939-C5)-methyltransferase